MGAQNFVDIQALKDLHIYKGVYKLFKNIGWEDEFQSGTVKASRIIHPVLKVTHQIIASLLFPQEEISKANKKELEVLWCMINKAEEVPHFGCWVVQKMLKSALSNDGQLHCGGIVSIIVEHLGLHLPNNPTNIILGHTRLSLDVMEIMHLFHRTPNRDVHWTLDGKEYLRTDIRNKKVLALANDIPSTHWHLQSNLGVTATRRRPTTTLTTPTQPTTVGASSSSRLIPFPEHNLYTGEFACLDHHYTSLQQE
ncbi:unnamed protein product [Lactuca saligna]|uniref:Arabidopsis retrotransposon Orf1 C-terminal domain-containing protein n=1 Tax=Lactuca saligna TaxID=75948 RepID=A0AA35ZT34_LACSI|nr:unnamed protein product [Lactuca saligna]